MLNRFFELSSFILVPIVISCSDFLKRRKKSNFPRGFQFFRRLVCTFTWIDIPRLCCKCIYVGKILLALKIGLALEKNLSNNWMKNSLNRKSLVWDATSPHVSEVRALFNGQNRCKSALSNFKPKCFMFGFILIRGFCCFLKPRAGAPQAKGHWDTGPRGGDTASQGQRRYWDTGTPAPGDTWMPKYTRKIDAMVL